MKRNIMKQFLLLIKAQFLFTFVFSQSNTTSYYFKEVGMSIMVPANFEIVESSEDEKLHRKGEKLLEDANNIQIDASSTKTLLSIKQGQFNYMNITVTPYKEVTKNNWTIDNNSVKKMLYNSFVDKVGSTNIDTATSGSNVDGLMLDRFEMTIRIRPSMTMKMLLYSRYYKGFDFGICYAFLDKVVGTQLENIVSNAKFRK